MLLDPKAIWLEVGFGAGEYLLSQLAQHPDIGFIGCEPYANGMAKFLSNLPQGQNNVRLYDGAGADLLPHFPDASLDKLILLYPDPWPKRRHSKHRFIQPSVLEQLARIMSKGAQIQFASDDSALVAWVLAHFAAQGQFLWQKNLNQNPSPPFWTRYEAKAMQLKKTPVRLVFSRT